MVKDVISRPPWKNVNCLNNEPHDTVDLGRAVLCHFDLATLAFRLREENMSMQQGENGMDLFYFCMGLKKFKTDLPHRKSADPRLNCINRLAISQIYNLQPAIHLNHT